MEREGFDLVAYLRGGVEAIVKDALRATAKNPRESTYMARFALASQEASRRRAKAEEGGEHVPPFLIASITSSCNLRCAGCYSREFGACGDVLENDQVSRGGGGCGAAPADQISQAGGGCGAASGQLSAEEWNQVFSEARRLGISFILLAGGEPLLRRDIIEDAGNYPEILFPIFTNGTLIDDGYIRLFDEKRNLLPVISIEGMRERTNARRGSGVYERVRSAMDAIRGSRLIFGVSVTATTANLREITSDEFLADLKESGCKAVIYVEYVPVAGDSEDLAFGDSERGYLKGRLSEAREKYNDMVFISFPGDEEKSFGCLAAGRGFFHINSSGGAEPCPFSPYSDTNVRDASLLGAMHSPLFESLQGRGVLAKDHGGGCVLFENRDEVEAILAEEAR